MRPEHIIVLLVGIAALLFFSWATRRPSARIEAKRRAMRRRFRRSLTNHSWRRW